MTRKTAIRTGAMTLCISVVLAILFGAVYMDDRAWGAFGDDSAGYIYLAGRLFSGLPLVTTDVLGAEGLAFFGDERLARWLIPTHSQFINPAGTIASKYPIGLSLLMAFAGKLVGSPDGFSLINPLCATANVVLVYLLAVFVFPRYRWRHVVGVLAGVGLGVSNVYYEYALAQPMREIPSITFLLLTTLSLVAVQRAWNKQSVVTIAATACAGFFYGMAVNIRETSIVILPALMVFVWMVTREAGWKTHLRKVLPYVGVFIVTMGISLLPMILNSRAISEQKVVFKPRDTSRVVLLSNIGHIQTLSIENIFNNQGKFRPGVGALPRYWNVVQHASPIPFFVLLVAVGWYFLWKQSKAYAVYFAIWIVAIIGLFSLWINPYSRYVLPVFPPLFLLGAYGLCELMAIGIPSVWRGRWARFLAGVCLCAIVVYAYAPVIAEVHAQYVADTHLLKAMAHSDVEALTALAAKIGPDPKQVVMFTGSSQYGTSETFEAYTGVKGIRFPLDQRFVFDPEEVSQFFDQMQNEGYDLFIWIDATSSPEALQWLSQHRITSIFTHQFSFQSDVHVYRVER